MATEKKLINHEVWLLVYTKAKQEIKANMNLQNQGFETFLPLIALNNKNDSQKSLVPVFPRYLFVKVNLDLEDWTYINSSYGVCNLVMFSEKLTPIPHNIINSIKDKLNESGVYKEDISVVDYKKGDKVSIKGGRFAGIEAIFLSRKSSDRVRLLLKLLSTSVEAEINTSDVEKKEIIKKFKF